MDIIVMSCLFIKPKNVLSMDRLFFIKTFKACIFLLEGIPKHFCIYKSNKL